MAGASVPIICHEDCDVTEVERHEVGCCVRVSLRTSDCVLAGQGRVERWRGGRRASTRQVGLQQ